jgi:hypothetical protein
VLPTIDVVLLLRGHDPLWTALLQQGRRLSRRRARPVWVPERDDTVRERLEPAVLPRWCRLQPGMSPRLQPEQRHHLSQRRDDLDVLVDHDLHGAVQPHQALHESRRLHGVPRLMDLRFRLLLRPVPGFHVRVVL